MRLSGRPVGEVTALPLPERLWIPLWSGSVSYSELAVSDGQRVSSGEVLATAPACYDVPLLAPRAGVVRLGVAERHVVLEELGHEDADTEGSRGALDAAHIPADLDPSVMKRHKLVRLGAWEFFADAHLDTIPDPFGTPQAVIVTTANFEPYHVRGDILLRRSFTAFTRGLEQIQSLLEYQRIYLAVPETESELAARVRETVRGHAWVKVVAIPLQYPGGHPRVLARRLGLKPDPEQPVWSTGVAGVLAADTALTGSRACTERVVSVGGPGAAEPRNVEAMLGYPLDGILTQWPATDDVRVLNGGVLTGSELEQTQRGVDSRCSGLTILPEHREREFLGFLRPGRDRNSYSSCFLSRLGAASGERLTTALRGERRACVACGMCADVCPASLYPHLIHRALYRDGLEEAERLRVDLCVECGLCAYVCPSKIELLDEFQGAIQTLRSDQESESETLLA